jgi:hypothetical protein
MWAQLDTETTCELVDDDLRVFIAAATGFSENLRGKKSPPPSTIQGCAYHFLFFFGFFFLFRLVPVTV